jgi:WD40 repeat protein
VGGDGAARLWQRDTGRLLETYRSTSLFLADAVIDPDRAMIIASGSDGLVWFWDLPTGRPLWKLQAHRSQTMGIHFEGSTLVTRGSSGEVSRGRAFADRAWGRRRRRGGIWVTALVLSIAAAAVAGLIWARELG